MFWFPVSVTASRLLLQNHTQVILCWIRDSNQDLQLRWRVGPWEKKKMPIWEYDVPGSVLVKGDRISGLQPLLHPQYTPFISKLCPIYLPFTNFVGHPTSTSHLRKGVICCWEMGSGKFWIGVFCKGKIWWTFSRRKCCLPFLKPNHVVLHIENNTISCISSKEVPKHILPNDGVYHGRIRNKNKKNQVLQNQVGNHPRPKEKPLWTRDHHAALLVREILDGSHHVSI